jgi:predicted DNA-binding protein
MPAHPVKWKQGNFRMSESVHQRLTGLAKKVRKSRAAVVRALIVGATLEDLPQAWTERSATEQVWLEEVEPER